MWNNNESPFTGPPSYTSEIHFDTEELNSKVRFKCRNMKFEKNAKKYTAISAQIPKTLFFNHYMCSYFIVKHDFEKKIDHLVRLESKFMLFGIVIVLD